MPDTVPTPAAPTRDHPRDFIFASELSEVYLLLDHISGRPDKTLLTAANAAFPPPADWIEQICEIGWPPEGTSVERAKQAATLLRAKDRLNAAAFPASGATIAFTVLVAGGDAGTRVQARRRWRFAPTSGAAAAPPSPMPPDYLWAGGVPSRTSLATIAYPGLVPTAVRFSRDIRIIIGALFFWLLFTCALSWDIAAGHAILQRIDTLARARVDINTRIDAADLEEAKTAAQITPVQAAVILPYCQRHRIADAAARMDEKFDSVGALRICRPLDQSNLAYRVSYADLADWLVLWTWVKKFPGAMFCPSDGCLAHGENEPKLSPNATDEQWASILNEVLASAVLPVFYGILGAGAAVVRDLWAKMRDSLLSPRDLTLALGQLALGAVIGACIGLFVTPSGTTAGAPTLTGAVALSASALSFIAGFGVEGVFVALERLLKRIFDVK